MAGTSKLQDPCANISLDQYLHFMLFAVQEMDDDHDEPNVDLQWLAMRGRAFVLPEDVTLRP